MGFLDRAIKKGLGDAISGAVQKAAAEVIAPAANAAAQRVADRTVGYAEQTTASLDQATANLTAASCGAASTPASPANADALSGLFGTLQSAAMSYSGAVASNVKVCSSCGSPAGVQESFCPSCGARLPEEALSAGYLCPDCGKQNDPGKRFCTGCGAKLPVTLAEDARAALKNEAVLTRWDSLLPQYPKWPFGGGELSIDQYNGYISFTATDTPRETLLRYCELLKQNGFAPLDPMAQESLYKTVGDTRYCFDCSEPYPADPGCLCVSFMSEAAPRDTNERDNTSRSVFGGLGDLKSGLGDLKGGLGDLKGGLGDLKGGLKDLKSKFKF